MVNIGRPPYDESVGQHQPGFSPLLAALAAVNSDAFNRRKRADERT